jgi:hypothetical protein
MSFACALLGSRRGRPAVSLVRATERTQGISRNQLLSDPSPLKFVGERSYCPAFHMATAPRVPRPRPTRLAVTRPNAPCPPVGQQAQGFPRSHGSSECID